MKNHEMFTFIREFDKFNGLEGFDFLILLNKNKRLFEQEAKDMQDVREANPKFKEYRDKVQELLAKYADRGEDGQPIIEPQQGQPGQGNYRLTKNRAEFNSVHIEIVKKYQKAIDKQNKLDQDFNAKVEKEMFAQPFFIKENLIPKTIKNEQMNLLFPLIKFKPLEEEVEEVIAEEVK